MKIREKAGFTMIEVLMALSIGLIVLTGGFEIIQIGNKYLDHTFILADVQSDSRLAIDRMVKEIQESKSGTLMLGSGAISISFASARDASGVFQSTSTGGPIWQKVVVYYLDSTAKKLYRYEETKTNWALNYDPATAIGNANAKEVIPNVTSLQFTIIPSTATSSSLATIAITVNKNTKAGKVIDSISTTVRFRN